MPDLLTARQSAAVLARAGLPRSRAREVLATGLAGPGTRTSAAVLYDAARVAELASRPVLGALDLEARFPRGLVVARRAVDVTAPWAAQAGALTGGWRVSVATALWFGIEAERHGPLPLVATVSGFVCFAAELRGVARKLVPGAVRGTTATDLDLAPPGAWSESLPACRLPGGAGHALAVHGAPWQRPRHALGCTA